MRVRRAALALLVILLRSAADGRASAGEMAALPPEPPASAITAWSAVADRLGQGSANWRTQAIMHLAMHDALNAAGPRYAWFLPPGPQEPPPAGAAPDVAMAAAAFQVLLIRHPDQAKALAEPLFNAALRRTAAASASVDSGIALGAAIAIATNSRLTMVSPAPHPFPVGTGVGGWRATPPFLQRAYVADYKPILAEESADLHGPLPPAPGTPR